MNWVGRGAWGWAGLALACLLLVSCSKQGDAAIDAPEASDLLERAAARLDEVLSFHFVLDHEAGRSPIVLNLAMERAEGDVLRPDRLRAEVKAVVQQLGSLKVEVTVVAVGEDAWITNPFSRDAWVAIPGSNPLAEIFDPAAGVTSVLRGVRDARVTGEERVDGYLTWRVEGTVDGGDLESFTPAAEEGYEVVGVVWIDQEDDLVRRIRLEGPLGFEDDGDVVRLLELSDFDKSIEIELP